MIFDIATLGVDGFFVLRAIRSFSQIPIVVLSAMCSEEDRIRALEIGVDDYMAKPYAPKELNLRIAAILRRSGTPDRQLAQELSCEGIHIDLTARRVFVDERHIPLTPKEFDLLTLLVGNPNVAFSRKQLLDMIWGGELSGGTRTLDTHIKQIRHAIAPYNTHIVTLRGVAIASNNNIPIRCSGSGSFFTCRQVRAG